MFQHSVSNSTKTFYLLVCRTKGGLLLLVASVAIGSLQLNTKCKQEMFLEFLYHISIYWHYLGIFLIIRKERWATEHWERMLY